MSIKKVCYYKLELSERDTQRKYTSSIKTLFDQIFTENSTQNGEYGCLILIPGEVKNGQRIERVTMDILINDSNYLFARVGKTKEFSEALIRNINTNECNGILSPEEISYKTLEICTYFLLDYSNGVIGFMQGQAAPSIRCLENIVMTHNDIYKMEIQNIVSNESVRALVTPGALLNKISYSFRVPNVEILKELGLGRNVIDKLKDTDLTQAQLIIRNDPRKYLSAKPGVISELISLFEEVNDRGSKVYFTGRTQNSSTQDYSFDVENISFSIDVPTTKIRDGSMEILSLAEIADEVFIRMRSSYLTNRIHIINLGNIA